MSLGSAVVGLVASFLVYRLNGFVGGLVPRRT